MISNLMIKHFCTKFLENWNFRQNPWDARQAWDQFIKHLYCLPGHCLSFEIGWSGLDFHSIPLYTLTRNLIKGFFSSFSLLVVVLACKCIVVVVPNYANTPTRMSPIYINFVVNILPRSEILFRDSLNSDSLQK